MEAEEVHCVVVQLDVASAMGHGMYDAAQAFAGNALGLYTPLEGAHRSL
jgi:hypothetical protein